jgi:hypothetical protein
VGDDDDDDDDYDVGGNSKGIVIFVIEFVEGVYIVLDTIQL